MATRYGKGNKAFTDLEAIDAVKERGIAQTSELAEEFEVSDVAIRKRLKEMNLVESRKIRNRRVWYIPHETELEPATADGSGFRWDVPFIGGLYDIGRVFRLGGSVLAVVFTVGAVWRIELILLAVASMALAVGAASVMEDYRDAADPSFEFGDLEAPLKEAREMERGSDDE